MARKQIRVSDMSGEEILDGHGATIKIQFEDARKGIYEVDATDEEAHKLAQQGRSVKRRGRRPKALAQQQPPVAA